ncbi:hypothetical protein [Paracidovorax cattleyae]|uniref:Uncharacterized protein n=1 Tax=Paracidovorax cattleyae TaxID=80868 RepID=A0A1H0REM8_9BURK|nr:hypothetical protein [Paracidovorax cattleyae]SDP27974.1 hypothetical protein SAMN04489708_11030 [Paracidovorax cattleyae]
MARATTQQIQLLHHTLGLRPDQRDAHRNHFVAGPGHHDMPDLEALEASGLMARGRSPSFIDKTDVVFHATDAGRELALQELPQPAKRSQHGQWLDADCGETFAEWLCRYGVPRYDMRWDRQGRFEYRMYRSPGGIRYDVTGDWAATKKAAKASYKAALKAHNSKEHP